MIEKQSADDATTVAPTAPARSPSVPAIAMLRRAGATSWAVLGLIGVVVVIALAVAAVSGILIPLIIAVIVGIVLEPLSAAVQRRGVPSVLATVACMLLALAVLAGTVAIVVVGFLRQWPEIYRQLNLGWASMLAWLNDLDADTQWLQHARTAFEEHLPQLGQGALSAVTSTFYGLLSLIMGTFFAVFFLFFVLRDGNRFPTWLAHSTAWHPDEVDAVAELTRQLLRGYFRGTAITALLTAPIFVIPLLILGVPLVIPIFVLYFFLSFVPFVGAWITGAFAVLIAFGSGGTGAALIVAVTFTVSNGTVQSAVSSWALGSSLKIHPVVVLLATMVGGTVAGLIGMVLGAPVTAAVVKSAAAVRRMRAERSGPVGEAL